MPAGWMARGVYGTEADADCRRCELTQDPGGLVELGATIFSMRR